MPRFQIKFTAKRKGAIGISSVFVEVVEADNDKQAVLKLYDKYDHIHLPMVKLLAEGEG